MKKLASLFIAALKVTGLATSAFAAGPAGYDRGRDGRTYQSQNERDGHQGGYAKQERHYDRYSRHGWGHHGRYGHNWDHHNRFWHGWGR